MAYDADDGLFGTQSKNAIGLSRNSQLPRLEHRWGGHSLPFSQVSTEETSLKRMVKHFRRHLRRTSHASL